MYCHLSLITAFTQGVWTQKTNFGGTARFFAFGFSIGTKGYIGTGAGSAFTKDFWEWDGDTSSPTYNTWTQKANFGGTPRNGTVGFSISNKGYIGTGYDANGYENDFWEWDGDTSSPTYNTWTQKANFGGTIRQNSVGFSIGAKGYIGTGNNASGYKQDFWEWNQATNVCTQKANFGGMARNGAAGFSIGKKGYIGTGYNGAYEQDFWEWNGDTSSPTYNTWTQKANFGGTAREYAIGFSIGTQGYLGTGTDGNGYTQDFWKWDQGTNVWTQKANFGGTARDESVGFSIGKKGYIGTGRNIVGMQDFWEYTPDSTNGINEINLDNYFSLYPNPSNGKINIQSTKNNVQYLSVDIYNLEGEKIYQSTLSSRQSQIDISNEPSGIYFLQVKTSVGIANKKTIIQK